MLMHRLLPAVPPSLPAPPSCSHLCSPQTRTRVTHSGGGGVPMLRKKRNWWYTSVGWINPNSIGNAQCAATGWSGSFYQRRGVDGTGRTDKQNLGLRKRRGAAKGGGGSRGTPRARGSDRQGVKSRRTPPAGGPGGGRGGRRRRGAAGGRAAAHPAPPRAAPSRRRAASLGTERAR